MRKILVTLASAATLVAGGTLGLAAADASPAPAGPAGVVVEDTDITRPGGTDATVIEAAGTITDGDTGYFGAAVQEVDGRLTLRYDRAVVLSAAQARGLGYAEPAGAVQVVDPSDDLRDVTLVPGVEVRTLSGATLTPDNLDDWLKSIRDGDRRLIDLTFDEHGQVVTISEHHLP